MHAPLTWFPAGSFLIHSGRFPSAISPHSCVGSYWVSFPQLMCHRSAETVCATGSSLLGRGQLLWDVVLQVSLASDTSIAVDVQSVPLDGFAAGSSELVIGHFPATCIQSAHLCLFPTSWHQLVAGLFLSTGFRPVTLDGSPARSYQLVTCLFSAAE